MNDGVVFYRSFYEAIKQIDNAEEKAKLYEMIIDYGLDGIEPENKDLISQVIFIMAKPQIDANIKRASNGKKGGRPTKTPVVPESFEPFEVMADEEPEPVQEPKKEEPKTDKYINPIKKFVEDTAKEVYGQKQLLSVESLDNLLKLNAEYSDFKETLYDTLKFVKKLKFKKLDYKPDINWLFKEDNYVKVRNGTWGQISTTANQPDDIDRQKEVNKLREEAIKLNPELAHLT